MKPSETPDIPQTSEFEQRLRSLLADYADAAPSDANIEAQVRAQLATASDATNANRRRWRTVRTGANGPRRRLGVGLRPALPTLAGAQTLSIDQFPLNHNQSPPLVKGPWVFHLSLG
ncbi:MAG: hypothetical protein ABI068_12855 [Ktedonobacterales bacterium]